MRTEFGAMTTFLSMLVAVPLIAAQQGSVSPAGDAADLKAVLARAGDAMGMLRGVRLQDSVVRIEYWASGSVNHEGQACMLARFRTSVNYAVPGMREDFACARSGAPEESHHIHVVAGSYAWNERLPGIDAVPMPSAASARLVQLWTTPLGIVKAAAMGGAKTVLTIRDGVRSITFPIPGVPDAIATATLNAQYFIDRVEARHAGVVTETAYSSYADWNDEDYKSDVKLPGRIVRKQGRTTTMDLTLTRTNTYNPYVIMPVPENVRARGSSGN